MVESLLQVREGRTELDVISDRQKTTTFIHPAYQGTYSELNDRIPADGLIRPSFRDSVDIVHAGFTNKNPDYAKYADYIKKIMKDAWVRGFTGIHYSKGVFVLDFPDVVNNTAVMNESDLEKKLGSREEDGVVYSDDGLLRFIPYGFKTEEMKVKDLARNRLVIAMAQDREGAEKLADIADKHRKNPYLLALTSVNEPVTRVSALCSVWDLGNWLGVLGNDHGDLRDGHAFGVQRKTGEASPAEKSL